MASILQFSAAENAKPRASKIAPDRRPLGQVVIFPGVRIERRQAEEGQPLAADSKPARARKK